jgi:glucosamine--fructose-6-phosphate aminotransferase (isomerizing)
MTKFAFDDQVASQEKAVAETLGTVEVPLLNRDRPLLFTGIGTSLHACRVAAYWVAELSGGRLRPAAIEAQDLALHGDIRSGDQIVVVSHRGTKRYPNEVLARAKAAGASTVTITGLGNPNPAGDVVLRTCPDETAGTHTVSYLTALAVLGKLVARMLGPDASDFAAALDAVPKAIGETLSLPAPTEIPKRLINREPVLITGHGIDEVTAEEAALKFKEGSYLWAEGMSQELAFHGTPAVLEPRMAAILIVPGREDGGRYLELRSLLLELGLEVLSCGTGDTDLPFAEVAYLVRPLVAIVPLQRLVGELARRRGSNPDKIRGDVEPWASAIPKVRL